MRLILRGSHALLLVTLMTFGAETADPAKQAVQTKMQTFAKDLPGCHSQSTPIRCASVHLAYPEVLSAPTAKAKTAIEQEISEMILAPLEKGKAPATAQEFASQILAHYQDWVRHGGDAHIPWAVSRKVEVAYNSPNVLCLRYSQSVEQGGAHPAADVLYVNFRPQDGSVLQLEDVIQGSRMNQFVQTAHKHYVRQAAPVRSTDSPNEQEAGQQFAVPKNFAIEGDGLHFRYDDEQVDPKSHGTPEFLVPYSK